ncbi:unnamed protein product [Meganyctiphanes norvegica]|uniref:Proline-rich AKT1 substrate 1 n=1 Tax=Meganyctiphanes norvegica TaxID=48144 RepID=A0AAV2RPQ0_MEGNR
MVQLVCSCLNVRIHVREKQDDIVSKARLPTLSPQESQHPFFAKGACGVSLDLAGIVTGQDFLVRSTPVGNWLVYECLNCHLHTHATSSGSKNFCVTTRIISDSNKLNMLLSCEGYSPVFQLVLPNVHEQKPMPPLSPTDFTDDRLPATDEAIKNIQQQVSRFLKKAEQQVEANIRTYTDQQQAFLSSLQTKARRDRQTLVRILSNIQITLPDDDPLAPFGPQGKREEDGDQFSFDNDVEAECDMEAQEALDVFSEPKLPPLLSLQGKPPSHVSPMPIHNITSGFKSMSLSSSVALPINRPQGNVRVAQSLDAQGLFEMEGMMEPDELLPHPRSAAGGFHSDEDDTDDSNQDEGIHIPGTGMRGRDMAKSVPISVPSFLGSRPIPSRQQEDDEEAKPTENVAASIHALARSVHTTSEDLFGELPRSNIKRNQTYFPIEL